MILKVLAMSVLYFNPPYLGKSVYLNQWLLHTAGVYNSLCLPSPEMKLASGLINK